ncbi:unnamed protein product [Orchesella dallaii]|uniref:Transmembrane protein n=1 Tax=Orchesella dallaii TaxID=48710 RepID=A0ABP1RV25_9HEXA
MLCCCCPKTNKAYIIVAISIFVELVCGLVATTWTALHNDPFIGCLSYAVLFIDLIFAFALSFFVVQDTLSRLQGNLKSSSSTLNWLFVLCTVWTFFLFLYNFRIDTHVPIVVKGQQIDTFLNRAFAVFLVTAYVLPMFYMICSIAHVVNELIPFKMFVVLMQLGAGLVITTRTALFNSEGITTNIWAYLIFGFELAFASAITIYLGRTIFCRVRQNLMPLNVVAFSVCLICTIVTAAVFGLVWAHNYLMLRDYKMPKLFVDSFGIYIFSFYWFTLLECIPESGNADDSFDEGKNCSEADSAYGIIAESKLDNYSTDEMYDLEKSFDPAPNSNGIIYA